MPSHSLKIWQEPVPGNTYAIGADPAEGLRHGDDSAACVLDCTSGEQVAELQGKIEPFAFAENLYALGLYYNSALLAIESNKDGGANKVLFELEYKNIYYEMKETGMPYQKPTAKLGYNMNVRTRGILVPQARKYLEDQSVVVRSDALLAQFETFILEDDKFQAIARGFDDLVIAFCIACEMLRVQLLRGDVANNTLNPIWKGKEVQEIGGEDIDAFWDDRPRSHRLAAKKLEEQDIVEASTMGNLAGF